MKWKWKRIDSEYCELFRGRYDLVARVWFWGGLWVGEILDFYGTVVRVITGHTELGVKRKIGKLLRV